MKMLYAGSFDPITKGHLDIIQRASQLTDDLIIGVAHNVNKKYLFSEEKRVELAQEAISDYTLGYLHEGVCKVCVVDGLLADFCEENKIEFIIRGLRANTDFEYEIQLYNINRCLCGVETIFFPSLPERTCISSSMVKELARHGKFPEEYITENVSDALKECYRYKDRYES